MLRYSSITLCVSALSAATRSEVSFLNALTRRSQVVAASSYCFWRPFTATTLWSSSCAVRDCATGYCASMNCTVEDVVPAISSRVRSTSTWAQVLAIVAAASAESPRATA